jgi:hypothetical protein
MRTHTKDAVDVQISSRHLRSHIAMISCMYTKHKTQKAKTWHDGKLLRTATKLLLYDEEERSLDSKPATEKEWDAEFPMLDFPKCVKH